MCSDTVYIITIVWACKQICMLIEESVISSVSYERCSIASRIQDVHTNTLTANTDGAGAVATWHKHKHAFFVFSSMNSSLGFPRESLGVSLQLDMFSEANQFTAHNKDPQNKEEALIMSYYVLLILPTVLKKWPSEPGTHTVIDCQLLNSQISPVRDLRVQRGDV